MVSRKTSSAGAFQVASAPGPFGDLGEDDDPVPFPHSEDLDDDHGDGLECFKLPPWREARGHGEGTRGEGREKVAAALRRSRS